MANKTDKKRQRELKLQYISDQQKKMEDWNKQRYEEMDNRIANYKLIETNFSDQDDFNVHINGLIKLEGQGLIRRTSGAFSTGTFVNAEFVEVANGQEWILYCMNEAPMGNGYVRKK